MKSLFKFFVKTTRVMAVAGALTAAGHACAASEWKAFSTPGGQAPLPMVLRTVSGKTIDLSALKGQVVLVNFWATWCEPCRDEMPSLDRLQHRLGGKGFMVLGVNIGEGAAHIQQFLKRIPVGFTIVRDSDSAVLKAWRVQVLPASFLIDKNGMLRYQLVGDAHWDEAEAQAPILELLK